MVDIHSHILAGLDDGPQTLEQSVAMVRVAAESGTTDIVATPHSDLRFTYDPEIVDRKIAELAAASGGSVRIHRGCDFHLYYENIQRALAQPSRYTINGKRYLLVEFSDVMILKSADEVFERMQAAGITPVVTHPERNMLLAGNPDQLRRWVEAGCRIQVTAQSFEGRFGRKAQAASENLIEIGLVHFIASDAHDAAHRPPALAKARDLIERNYGKPSAERLFVINPRAVLTGEVVDVAGTHVRARKWRRWW